MTEGYVREDNNPYDWEPFAASPASWGGLGCAMAAIAETIPVPPGVERIVDDPPKIDGANVHVGDAELHFYRSCQPPHQAWVSVSAPDGYADFSLVGGTWRYADKAPIKFAPFQAWYDLDDMDAADVVEVLAKVPPPTIADANAQWEERLATAASKEVEDAKTREA